MNVPYKAFIVFGDYYLNPTTKKEKEAEQVENDKKEEQQQPTLVELKLSDDKVNETVLDALAMLNKVFVQEQKSENPKINNK